MSPRPVGERLRAVLLAAVLLVSVVVGPGVAPAAADDTTPGGGGTGGGTVSYEDGFGGASPLENYGANPTSAWNVESKIDGASLHADATDAANPTAFLNGQLVDPGEGVRYEFDFTVSGDYVNQNAKAYLATESGTWQTKFAVFGGKVRIGGPDGDNREIGADLQAGTTYHVTWTVEDATSTVEISGGGTTETLTYEHDAPLDVRTVGVGVRSPEDDSKPEGGFGANKDGETWFDNLKVTDLPADGGQSGPTAAFEFSEPVNATDPVTFDASGSSSPAGIAEYRWTFGAEQASGETVTRTFAEPGTYQVSLQVVDEQGRTNRTTRTVRVGSAVYEARLDYAPQPANATEPIEFNASASSMPGSIESYEWSFGDGGEASGESVTHTYASAGEYTVSLTVTDDGGETNTTERVVTVGPSPVDAAFDYAPQPANATEPVEFNATNSSAGEDGTLTSYEWSFGDGTNATGATVNHTFATAGNYTVNLTVTAESGANATTNRTVEVEPNGTLIVDVGNESAPYQEIVPAIDDAEANETVLVRPGAYNASNGPIAVGKNISVVAPEGAVVDRAGRSISTAFSVGSGAKPTIGGFVVRDFETAVDASGTGTDWTVRNLTTEATTTGVNAFDTTGDWTVRDLDHRPEEFRKGTGVNARRSAGDWTVTGSAVANVSLGVGAADSDGNWTVTDTALRGTTTGVDAGGATGAWTLAGTTIAGADTLVLAPDTTGDWTVTDLTAADGGGLVARGSEGDWTVSESAFDGTDGIRAAGTTGDWRVRTVSLVGGDAAAVSATDSEGAWTVVNATLDGNAVGVDATGATGAWTVRESRVRDNADGGIVADSTAAAWLVRDSRVRGNGVGVSAADATGDWAMRNVSVRDSGEVGLQASGAAGDWVVSNASTVASSPVGVEARATTGDWEIHRTNITANDLDVDATDAAPEGNARRNYWGPNGAADADCEGNVVCANPLAGPAGGFQTGLDVRVVGPSGDAMDGAEVYLYAPGDANPVTVRTWDPTEEGSVPDGAAQSALVGEEALVRFNDRDAGKHCLLVVPPGDDLAPAGRCVPVTDDVVTDQRFVLGPPAEEFDATSVWNQFQVDPQNTGQADIAGPRTAVVEQWSYGIGDRKVIGSPVVHRDTVFVPAVSDTLYALDADTGEELWTFEGEGQTNGPAAADGTVYFRAGGTLHALDATTGSEEWSAPIENGVGSAFTRSSVALVDDKVIVPVTRGDQSSGYVAYEADTGEVAWDQRFEDRPVAFTVPTAAANEDESRVFVGATDGSGSTGSIAVNAPVGGTKYVGNVYEISVETAATGSKSWTTLLALDTDTGEVEWTGEKIGTSVFGAPTFARFNGTGVLYAPSQGRKAPQMFARDAETGKRIPWIQEQGNIQRSAGVEGLNGLYGSPAVEGAKLFFGDGAFLTSGAPKGETAFVRLDAQESAYRETTWTLPTRGSHAASPAVTENTVYSALTSRIGAGQLYAVDRESGDQLWTYEVGDIQASPAIYERSVIAATSNAAEGPQTVFSLGSAFARPADELYDLSTAKGGYVGHLAYDPVAEDAVFDDPTVTSFIDDDEDQRDPGVETIEGTTVRYETATFTGEAGQSVRAVMNGEVTGGQTLEVVEAGSLSLVGPEGTVLGQDDLGTGTAAVETTLPRDGVYTLVMANDRVASEGGSTKYALSLQSPAATRSATERTDDQVELDVRNAEAGQAVAADVPESVSPRVESVSVTLANDTETGTFEVSASTDRPSDLPAAPDASEPAYLQVGHRNVPDSAIGAGEITLRLPKDGVDDPSNVTVYRYRDGWEALSTERVGTTADAYRFRVRTPGYSTFAVVTSEPLATPGASEDGTTARQSVAEPTPDRDEPAPERARATVVLRNADAGPAHGVTLTPVEETAPGVRIADVEGDGRFGEGGAVRVGTIDGNGTASVTVTFVGDEIDGPIEMRIASRADGSRTARTAVLRVEGAPGGSGARNVSVPERVAVDGHDRPRWTVDPATVPATAYNRTTVTTRNGSRAVTVDTDGDSRAEVVLVDEDGDGAVEPTRAQFEQLYPELEWRVWRALLD